MKTKLAEINVSLEDLLLDPNNPRFLNNTATATHVADKEAGEESVQKSLMRKFAPPSAPSSGEEDVSQETTDIQDLRDSMLRIGYVAIDKIVVRRTSDKKRYIVIEGNRRVATLKSLHSDYSDGRAPFHKPAQRTSYESHRISYEKLTVLELHTDGLEKAELEKAISVILGIRHHGSLLPWQPLARAFNIYSEYKRVAGEDFTDIERRLTKMVAEKLCISQSEVQQALQSYIAYLQLHDVIPERLRNDDYSLIQAAVTNRVLRGSYLQINENTYRLDEASIEKLIRVGQFGTRDNLPVIGGAKKILSDPRAVRRLSAIVQKRRAAKNEGERGYIENVLSRVEDEMDPLSVDDGLDDVVAYLEALNWREDIASLLAEQREKLSVDLYEATGNERGLRESAEHVVRNIARIMDIQ